MKRLALFLDGTWNTVKSDTNVWELHKLVAPAANGIPQIAYYDPGVGTKRFQWIRGGALGYGLDDNIVQAYEWLRSTEVNGGRYEPGDELYIFGFSRGAYTARSLAGFIAKCGLLYPSATITASELFRRYQLAKAKRPIYTLEYIKSQGGALTEEERALLTQSRRVPIQMIGVWDTVGALGIPFGSIPGLSRSQLQFHNTRLSNIYEYAYHALAVDEQREAFEPTLWTKFRPTIPDPETGAPKREPVVEQRWFAGAHADVGGGNPTTLPQLPLAWLQSKASDVGLAMTETFVAQPTAYRGPITDSFATFMFGIYRLLKLNRRFDRTIQADTVLKGTGTVETVNETIDASVFERYRADARYRPKPLTFWAAKRSVDPAAIDHSISARTLQQVT